jgi:hypothetical protein
VLWMKGGGAAAARAVCLSFVVGLYYIPPTGALRIIVPMRHTHTHTHTHT